MNEGRNTVRLKDALCKLPIHSCCWPTFVQLTCMYVVSGSHHMECVPADSLNFVMFSVLGIFLLLEACIFLGLFFASLSVSTTVFTRF